MSGLVKAAGAYFYIVRCECCLLESHAQKKDAAEVGWRLGNFEWLFDIYNVLSLSGLRED